ncbi:MAG: hypothetical protein WCY82_07460 [Desulfotomaculaceae bacterium]
MNLLIGLAAGFFGGLVGLGGGSLCQCPSGMETQEVIWRIFNSGCRAVTLAGIMVKTALHMAMLLILELI